MEIKNGIIIDDIAYECVRGEGENVSLRRIGKVRDILVAPEAIDLGLSVKWASCNIGAEKPSDYGDYFAWGETETKFTYKFNNSVTYGIKMGSIAGDPKYDVARANWGGTWRLPTKEEIDELVSKCEHEWMTQGGHNGYKITGPSGNSIFLPAAGQRVLTELISVGEYCNYRSAMPEGNSLVSAYCLNIKSDTFSTLSDFREYGCPVRPVTE